jgi:hypothetical protein
MHDPYLKKRTKFKPVNLNIRDYLGDLCDKERIILKLVFRKQGVTTWTRFIWLRACTSDRFLSTRYEDLQFP